MKNIETILAEAGIELTDDQKKSITAAVNENYKTIAEFDKQKDKLTSAEDKVTTLTASLDKFKDVDVDKLNSTIEDLKKDLKAKDDDYAAKMAERDFQDALNSAIGAAKGRNAKAIKALLDIDALKASKNQKDDIDAALKALAEGEDSYLFGEPEAKPTGKKIDVGGRVHGGGNDDVSEAQMREAMGLPPKAEENGKDK